MKRILFLMSVLLVGMFFTQQAAAQATSTERDIIIDDAKGKPIRPKSLQVFPITASISNGVVRVQFTDALNVNVVVTSLEDGTVVYSETVDSAVTSTLMIDLSTQPPGEYRIVFTYDDTMLYGEFVLDV